jgi:hypothetical protein
LRCLAHFPFDPEDRVAGKSLRLIALFGNPANSESPVALRPPLAGGLPFRLLERQQ